MCKSLLVLLLAIALGVAVADQSCPEDICARVRCAMPECPNGRINPTGGFCGCCPICIQQLGEGENCQATFLVDVPQTVECADGLQCDSQTGTCAKSTLNPCHQELAQKEKLLESAGGNLPGLKMPTCDEQGFYTAVQCAENTCSCVKADGTPITGYSVSRSQAAEQMNCQCARDKAEKEQSNAMLLGRPNRQCDVMGNYKKRQCREGVCNCVDRYGQPINGYQANINQAPKMSCECAHRNSEMQITGEKRMPYDCDELGNFIDE